MKSKSSIRLLTLLISIEGIVLASILMVSMNLNLNDVVAYKNDLITYKKPTIQIKSQKNVIEKNNEIPEIKKDTDPIKLGIGLPIRLVIPNIGVNAKVEYVGQTSKGYLDTPAGIVNVAWYDRGHLPGEKGSSIIDGHFGWKKGKPAVFNNLNKLKKGDKVYIHDANGTTIAFKVRELKTFGLNDDAPEIFDANDSKSHLNFITCHGVWDKSKKIYKSRLVVFTDRIID